MKKKVSVKNIFNASVILLSLGMLWSFSLSENGLKDLLRIAKTFDKGWLFMAVFCHVINVLVDAYLIYRFTSSSCKGYSFRNAFKSCMVGQFFSAITPFSTGGQPMQIYLMSKQGVAPGVSTAALTQRFLVYQATLTAYSALAILVRFQFLNNALNNPVMWSFAIFGFASQAFVMFMLLLFSFNRKLTHLLLRGGAKLLTKLHFVKKAEERINAFEAQLAAFHESSRELFKNKQLVLETYVVSAIQLTAIFIVPYCVYRSFGLYGAHITDMICSQAFVTMASCFMPLPGAAGASEVSFIGFFKMFFTPDTLKSGVLVWRIITYYATILCTAPFSHLGKQKPGKVQSAA